jgi:hypothetical protein
VRRVSTKGCSPLTFDVQKRWNIISVPVLVPDYRKIQLFPEALSDAYSYNGDYKIEDTLANRKGYWLKFDSNRVVGMAGTWVMNDTFEVRGGWNLIGSIASLVPVSSVLSIPGEMTTSSFFEYSGSYIIVDTLYPGKGYWVKVSEAGALILSSSGRINPSTQIRIVSSAELPPAPPEYVTPKDASIPKNYVLDDAFPNPLNPATTLKYQLPVDSRVLLRVYNLLGEVVSTLLNEEQSAGYKSIDWNAGNCASGVYFYRIEAVSTADPGQSYTQVKKMLLLK